MPLRFKPFGLILAALLFSLMAPAHAVAQTPAPTGEPPSEPVLRIEIGMHTGIIRRIGVDAANRYLVTASADKTVRVWELPSGRLLRIIRPPIGEGNEGKIYAVAISPDGATVAAAGWTGFEWDKIISIYLFDRESGRMVRRIRGLPQVIDHLVYSPDGQYLAATLGHNGIRVYQTSTYAQIGEDLSYGSRSNGADFDRTGRLVTSAYDGFIRIYAPIAAGAFHLIAKQSVTEGKKPFGISFSPDGTRIAVGFDGSTRISVLAASDLSLLYAPDMAGVNDALYSVAWSADGRTLYAGGRAVDANQRPVIRAWTDGGRGSHRDLVAAADAIMHILPLRDGGVVYGAADPAFGILDADGRRILFAGPSLADYRDNEPGFLLSPDGMGVQFSYEDFGKSPARFSVGDRRLEGPPSGGSNWRPPETDDGNLRVSDWHKTVHPKLNGVPLNLNEYEMSLCVALSPDRSTFLLGTEHYFRLFDRSGVLRWLVPVAGEAWAVNISADGRLAVAAYGDGTIRWYRMKDGKELLAFFPHPDKKRWVLWTPSGYYDASPGAEELIGWHVNRGKDQAADFFPVAQFRDTYYRPDVIARVLTAGDEAVALQQANEVAGRRQQQVDLAKQLPPVVEIISPSDGAMVASSEITVRFRLRSPSGEPVTNVRALIDGRPADSARQLVQQADSADGKRELRIAVPEGDSTVSVIAENRYATSVPANLRVHAHRPATPTTAAAPETIVIKPKLYILAVGVSKYGNEKYNLQFADKDARDFVAVMQTQKGLLYRDVVVKLLTNDQASKDEVLDGLDWIRKETTSNDVAMVFFSGHGINDSTNHYFFCPYNIDPDRLLRTGVAFSDLKNTISAIAGKALFFVDTCHSGNSLGLGGAKGGLDINIVINELSSAENGAVVFSASTGSESSFERPEWNNGAFTKAVVEGLNGGAAYGNSGRITYNMLNLFVSERVKELTKGQQHPTMIPPQTVPDFPIALRK